MSTTKDTILTFRRKPTESVDVPEWGGPVYVRVMSGTERDAFESETYTLNGKNVQINRANFRARLLVRCIADADGNRLFADRDAAALGECPSDLLDRVFAVAQRANGMTPADVESLTKNSDSAPSVSSGSGSPVT